MIDLVLTLSVAAFFAAAWSAGRFLPRFLAAGFPMAAMIVVAVIALTVGVSSIRDWLMAGVVVCVTALVTMAGRSARRKAVHGDEPSSSASA